MQVIAARMATAACTRAATTDAVSRSYAAQLQVLSERINRMSRMDQVNASHQCLALLSCEALGPSLK